MTQKDIQPSTWIECVRPSIEVVGGGAPMQYGVRQMCERHGFETATPGDVRIVLDGPVGFALTTLLQQPSDRPTVVWTSNTSLAYCADLWDLQPTVLLTSAAPDLASAVYAAAQGESYCEPALDQLPLDINERHILQWVALGLSNRTIANALSMYEQMVASNVTQICEKLHLVGRNAAMLYYWGMPPGSLISLLTRHRDDQLIV